MKQGDLEDASRLYKAKTGVGCDGFHPKVLLDLTKETRGEIVEFLGVTSERPIAHTPKLIRWWEALRAPEVAK